MAPHLTLGMPLLAAITHLQSGVAAQIHAAAYKARRGADRRDDAERAEPLLWGSLKGRIFSGELEAVGVKDGNETASTIPHSFINAALPDYVNSSLTVGSLSFYGVLIRECGSGQVGSAGPTTNYKTGAQVGHQSADAILLTEMAALIAGGKATGPMNAARSLVSLAVGSGTDESKVKRLARAFNRLHGQSGQSGQS